MGSLHNRTRANSLEEEFNEKNNGVYWPENVKKVYKGNFQSLTQSKVIWSKRQVDFQNGKLKLPNRQYMDMLDFMSIEFGHSE